MDEEIIVSGYCRANDSSRVLVCEISKNADGIDIDTDCMYPQCKFSSECVLIKRLFEENGIK